MPNPIPPNPQKNHWITRLAIALFAAAPAIAQPADPPPPADPPAQADDDTPDEPAFTREQRLAQLADEDYAVRAAATFALLQDDTIDEPALADMLANADHPEQRRRLVHIAEHHLMRVRLEQVADDLRGDGPPDRAAVGFAYNPILPGDNPHGPDAAFVILATMPGFPGHAYLLPGDLLLAIDGQSSQSDTAVRVRDWVGRTIGRHREGESIALTVFREGATIEITLNCAGIATLNEVYKTTAAGESARIPLYQDALDQALARLTDTLAPLAEPLAPAE